MSSPERHDLHGAAVRTLLWAERAVFFCIGILLFAAAASMLVRGVGVLVPLVTGPASATLASASAFLDVVLLILMLAELAYTVMLSLRGVVLSAEPFLIVGLIAVIRRILVITVGDVKPEGAGSIGASPTTELLILTAVVLAFVVSIMLLRTRPRKEDAESLRPVE